MRRSSSVVWAAVPLLVLLGSCAAQDYSPTFIIPENPLGNEVENEAPATHWTVSPDDEFSLPTQSPMMGTITQVRPLGAEIPGSDYDLWRAGKTDPRPERGTMLAKYVDGPVPDIRANPLPGPTPYAFLETDSQAGPDPRVLNNPNAVVGNADDPLGSSPNSAPNRITIIPAANLQPQGVDVVYSRLSANHPDNRVTLPIPDAYKFYMTNLASQRPVLWMPKWANSMVGEEKITDLTPLQYIELSAEVNNFHQAAFKAHEQAQCRNCDFV